MSQEKAITAVRLLLPAAFHSGLQAWLSASGVPIKRGCRLQYTAYGWSADGQKPLVISVISCGRVDTQSVLAVASWAREWFAKTNKAGQVEASAQKLIRAAG